MLTSNHCFDFSHYYKFGHFDMQRCLDESYKYIKISLISNSNPSKFKKKKEYMIRLQYSRRDKLAGFDEQKENAPDQASAFCFTFHLILRPWKSNVLLFDFFISQRENILPNYSFLMQF